MTPDELLLLMATECLCALMASDIIAPSSGTKSEMDLTELDRSWQTISSPNASRPIMPDTARGAPSGGLVGALPSRADAEAETSSMRLKPRSMPNLESFFGQGSR